MILTQFLISASLALTWNLSTSPNITNYNILVGYTSSNWFQTNAVGTNCTFTISNAIPGRQYFYAANCQNTNGDLSALSNVISNTVPVPKPFLIAPTSMGILVASNLAPCVRYALLASTNFSTWKTKLCFTANNTNELLGTDMDDQPGRFLKLKVIPWFFMPVNTNRPKTNAIIMPPMP